MATESERADQAVAIAETAGRAVERLRARVKALEDALKALPTVPPPPPKRTAGDALYLLISDARARLILAIAVGGAILAPFVAFAVAIAPETATIFLSLVGAAHDAAAP